MAKDTNSIKHSMLKSLRSVEAIIPLYTSGIINEAEAVSALKEKFNYDKSYDVILGFIDRKMLAARDAWGQEVTKDYISKSEAGIIFALRNEIFTREELKPFVFMYLIQSVNEDRRNGAKKFVSTGVKLQQFKSNGALSDKDEDALLTAVHLLKADLYQMPEPLKLT